MEPRNDNEIVIYDEEGNEYLMNILFTFENEERGAEYVFLYEPSSPEEVILMKYNENHELFEVTDEEELKEADEVLEAYNSDATIQDIKD